MMQDKTIGGRSANPQHARLASRQRGPSFSSAPRAVLQPGLRLANNGGVPYVAFQGSPNHTHQTVGLPPSQRKSFAASIGKAPRFPTVPPAPRPLGW